jgi:hypothetical protein
MNSGEAGKYDTFAHVGIAYKQYLHNKKLFCPCENAIGHSETDRYLAAVHFKNGGAPHESGADFAYPLSWPDAERLQTAYQCMSSINTDHHTALSLSHLGRSYDLRLLHEFTPSLSSDCAPGKVANPRHPDKILLTGNLYLERCAIIPLLLLFL